MKYSLRSLMRFSIRDIALVTLIVALVLGWGVDHRRQGAAKQKLQASEQLWKERADGLLELFSASSLGRRYRWQAGPSLAPEEVKP